MVYSFKRLSALFAILCTQATLPMATHQLSHLTVIAEYACSDTVKYMRVLNDNSIRIQEGDNLYTLNPFTTKNAIQESAPVSGYTLQIIANSLYIYDNSMPNIYENSMPKYCLIHTIPMTLAAISTDNKYIAICAKQKIVVYELPQEQAVQPEPIAPQIQTIEIPIEPIASHTVTPKPWYQKYTNLLSKHKWNIVHTAAKMAAGACLYAWYNKTQARNWNLFNLFGEKNTVQ